ncbi:MAG: hypothetical protein NVS4B9_33950 [Ktedonobacteraceae bacterium]
MIFRYMFNQVDASALLWHSASPMFEHTHFQQRVERFVELDQHQMVLVTTLQLSGNQGD